MAGLFLVVLLGVPLAQAAPEPKEVEYAYPDQSVWTTRLNQRGEPDNPLLRLAAVLFAKAGIPWHGQAYPATRMFGYLKGGLTDFSMLVASPALRECCLLSRNPVAVTELRLYRLDYRPALGGKEGLVGKRVITIRGYSYGNLLEFISDPAKRITNYVAAKHENAFAMLEGDRADYLLDYAGPASEVLADQAMPGLDYEVLSRLDVFLVLSKTYPDAAEVMARLEAIADTLDKDSIIWGK